MEGDIRDINQNLIKLRRDIELIKNILMAEGKLSEYAKRELAKARAEKEEDYSDLDEL